jgi:hypothetical protein
MHAEYDWCGYIYGPSYVNGETQLLVAFNQKGVLAPFLNMQINERCGSANLKSLISSQNIWQAHACTF